ncbi:hypothetical protein [Sinomonas sp. R1AF57]|uniref:hypothetical protein n=1 Tax=Sinomonas sp. R1AF57 TaxID=2020377 RepID=UPI000B5E57BA|nr:hypothetical protein [Sinomonas sp. R1AF57]ASN51410.1 hypothetical protein CGQ25_04410 [Sinomonas sp. R1AF57]
MQNLLIALSQTPPSPEGTLRPGLSEDQITPGTWGFLLTAFVVVLTILLIVDMVRRLRRVRYRAQVEEAREAESAPEKAERAPEKGEPEA